MLDDDALDDAIQMATERSVKAQADVNRSIDAPDAFPNRVEVAVNRAEDLHILAEEAADDPDAAS